MQVSILPQVCNTNTSTPPQLSLLDKMPNSFDSINLQDQLHLTQGCWGILGFPQVHPLYARKSSTFSLRVLTPPTRSKQCLLKHFSFLTDTSPTSELLSPNAVCQVLQIWRWGAMTVGVRPTTFTWELEVNPLSVWILLCSMLGLKKKKFWILS